MKIKSSKNISNNKKKMSSMSSNNSSGSSGSSLLSSLSHGVASGVGIGAGIEAVRQLGNVMSSSTTENKCEGVKELYSKLNCECENSDNKKVCKEIRDDIDKLCELI